MAKCSQDGRNWEHRDSDSCLLKERSTWSLENTEFPGSVIAKVETAPSHSWRLGEQEQSTQEPGQLLRATSVPLPGLVCAEQHRTSASGIICLVTELGVLVGDNGYCSHILFQ